MHDVHVEDPEVGDMLPAGQFEQFVDVVALGDAENVPALQLVQTDDPGVAANLPAIQSVQNDDPVVAACVPTTQDEHTEPPVVDMNVPGAHGAHTNPAVENVPGEHNSHWLEPYADPTLHRACPVSLN